MKKKIILLFFIIIFSSLIFFLLSDGTRYIGVNKIVKKQNIPNYIKVIEFYERHSNYKKLVKTINESPNPKYQNKVLNISLWVYQNIKKVKKEEEVIDLHTWTIIERKLGAPDQFSDVLSVLLVYSNYDSFFTRRFNISHPITFFKTNNYWSIIDPYYGVYFQTNNNLSNIENIKNNNRNMYHLTLGKVNFQNFKTIFFDKKFDNLNELNLYYNNLMNYFPGDKNIDEINLYDRGIGSRSYAQKPFHRILFQIHKIKDYYLNSK